MIILCTGAWLTLSSDVEAFLKDLLICTNLESVIHLFGVRICLVKTDRSIGGAGATGNGVNANVMRLPKGLGRNRRKGKETLRISQQFPRPIGRGNQSQRRHP